MIAFERRRGPRPAVIGTCTFSGPKWRPPGAPDLPTGEQLLDAGLEMVDRMAAQAAAQGWALDMVLLPEHFAVPPHTPLGVAAQTLDGPLLAAMAEKARDHRTYAAVPLKLRDGDTIYNSTVILDRRGEAVGVYHKVFPVPMDDGTLEFGITPGREFPVFDLDFGRVGVQICYDVFFDAGWDALALQGAEVVLFPSAAPGVSALRSHAYRFGYYVVASSYRPPALVVDPTGRDLASAAGDDEALVFRADLDYRVLPSSLLSIWGPARSEKYRGRIDIGWRSDEGMCLVTSLDPELPVGDFLAREGLETHQERLERSIPAQDAARGGPPAAG